MIRRLPAASIVALAAAFLAAGVLADEAKPAAAAKDAEKKAEVAPGMEALPELPLLYTGNIMLMDPSPNIVRLRVTVERWTTNEDRKKMFEALKAGGTPAVVSVLEDMNAGYIQLENNLRWPARVATIWKEGANTRVRFATNRPMYWGEIYKGTRSEDYPIGIIELTLPPEGKGEGTLVFATQAGFDKDGRIEVRSLPTNTGPQRVTNVEVEAKKKK